MAVKKNIGYASLSVLIAMIISLLYIQKLVKEEIEINKSKATFILENQAQSIKGNLIFTMEQVYQLRAMLYCSDCTKIQDIDPAPIVNRIIAKPYVRNILIAPNGIAQKVIPLKGNEEVIGLNLLGNENKSNKEAMDAMYGTELVLVGPYELKQGGQAFSGRLAMVKDKEGKWGLVSVTVDFPDIIEESASNFLKKLNYNFIFSKKNQKTGEFTPLLSSKSKPIRPVKVCFKVQNMDFSLCAAPIDGWFDRKATKINILAFMAVSIALGISIGLILFNRQKLIEKASQDPLTNIYNRVGANKAIKKIQKKSEYTHGALVIFDLDHFKSVNDQLGHQIGDRLLIETAIAIKGSIRAIDIFSRLGGDEFMVYFPFVETDNFIEHKMKEFLKVLDRTVTFKKKSVRVTASIGVTSFKVGTVKQSEAYKSADEALYKSKENGKNQVSFSS